MDQTKTKVYNKKTYRVYQIIIIGKATNLTNGIRGLVTEFIRQMKI